MKSAFVSSLRFRSDVASQTVENYKSYTWMPGVLISIDSSVRVHACVCVCVSLFVCVVMSFNSVPRRNLLVYPQWRALQYGVGNPVSLSLLSSSADDSLPLALMCGLYVCVIKDKTASRGVCLSVLDWDIVGNEPKQTTALLRAVNVAWIWCKFKIRPFAFPTF
jgi:hypothetical protein